MSGFALTHSDIGGYTGTDLKLPYVGWRLFACWHLVRSRELLMRWAEMNVFAGAVFRSHEGLLPAAFHQPWCDGHTAKRPRLREPQLDTAASSEDGFCFSCPMRACGRRRPTIAF